MTESKARLKLPTLTNAPMQTQAQPHNPMIVGLPTAEAPPPAGFVSNFDSSDLKPAVVELPTESGAQSVASITIPTSTTVPASTTSPTSTITITSVPVSNTSSTISSPSQPQQLPASPIMGVVQPDATPAQYTTIDSLARREAATAQQTAVRAEQTAQAAQTRIVSAMDNITAIQTQTASITKQIEDLTTKLGSLRSEGLTMKDEVWATVERMRRDVETFKSSVAGQLAQHGMAVPTSLPRLKLVRNPARTVMYAPPTVVDGAVVIYYNQEKTDGTDANRRLKQGVPEQVNTGYRITVPQGYVCDVVVKTEVVQTLQGKTGGDFVLNYIPRLGQEVRTGNELCRLVLRKAEPCELELS